MAQLNKILFCIVFFLTFSISINTSAADLVLDNQSGDKGDTATFTVSIESAPNKVISLGFEVRYDASVLNYSGHTAGSLVDGFDFFNANNTSPGVVRVGGFVVAEMNPGAEISEGTGGALVSLEFDVIGHEDSRLTLAALKDDIQNWTTKNGQFTGDHLVEPESEPGSFVSDTSQPRISQPDIPDINAVDSNATAYFVPDRYAGNLPFSRERGVIFRDESVREGRIAKKREAINMAQQKNNEKHVSRVAKTGENKAASDVNNLPERSYTEAQSSPDFVEISNSKEIQTDGLRMLIVTMILFGSTCYLAIGLSILLAGCFFWQLFKMGGRQIVTR